MLGPPRRRPAGHADALPRSARGRSFAGRWQLAAFFAVALIGPGLAMGAREQWGASVAAAVVLVELVSLAVLALLARRHSEAWLQARARRERFEAAQRAAMELADATLYASDGETAEHSSEVAQLCEVLCEEFKIKGEDRAKVLMAAHLHDIGKVAISPEILNKPGPLDAEEWAVIKKHTLVGERIIDAVPELGHAAPLVRHSHEHWDGSGYPDGLTRDQIPLGSRVVLCADAFHAIRSDRPYRKGRSPQEAMAEMRAHAGTQFDPQMVAALERQVSRVRRGLGARVPLSRRAVALLIGGILVLSGTALATGILPLSAPDAEQPAAPSRDKGVRPAPDAPATPRPGGHGPGGGAARATPGHASDATAVRARPQPTESKSTDSAGAQRGQVASADSGSTHSERGPDHPTPVRARGNPVQANGVAVGRPPSVVPRGKGVVQVTDVIKGPASSR